MRVRPLCCLALLCLASLGVGFSGCATRGSPAAASAPAVRVASATPLATPSVKAAAPTAPPVAPTAKPAALAAASKSGPARCAAGSTLVWADNDTAKCLRSCDGTDASCAMGQSCVPGTVADDDGNPIPHDIVNICLGPSEAVLDVGPRACCGMPAVERLREYGIGRTGVSH